MSSSASIMCSSKFCDSHAAGVSPASGLAFCKRHLDNESRKVTQREAELLQQLESLIAKSNRHALRSEQQALVVELQEIEDMFDAVQERLLQWRKRVLSRVQHVHDMVATRLGDAARAEECFKEINAMKDQGDSRPYIEAMVSVESWVDEACARSVEFDRIRAELRSLQGQNGKDVNLRSVGDVAAGVQQLQYAMDSHMNSVMQQCWLEAADTNLSVCRFLSAITDLPGEPRYIVLCSNTGGFFSDSTGRVICADPAAVDCEPLPQSCLFVSITEKMADYLLVMSLNGVVRLRCYSSSLDWSERIFGLHCDNGRQQLFLAQLSRVTAIDLCGQVTRVIDSNSLGQRVSYFSGLDGNADKLFLVNAEERNVLAICKDSGQLEVSISLNDIHSSAGVIRKVSLHGSKLLLSDAEFVYRLCGISGQLIASYPSRLIPELSKFKNPTHVTVDTRGLMFVSSHADHTVQVLSCNRALLQALGISGQCGSGTTMFNSQVGMAVVNDAFNTRLYVADMSNRRVCVFCI